MADCGYVITFNMPFLFFICFILFFVVELLPNL